MLTLGTCLLSLGCAPPRVAHRDPPGPAAEPARETASTDTPDRDYLAFVASEGTDKIALVRFGPGGARVERETTTGLMPADIDGPHGLAVSPDKRFYYTTTAHGTPYGLLWKYAAANDSLIGMVTLGNFPATLQITPDGAFAYVVNFNLHGEMVPSSVSVVSTDEMVEIARIPTCTMPHGSRINRQGTRHYSACMMDDMLVEIDLQTFAVSRHFKLTRGAEQGMPGAPASRSVAAGQGDGPDYAGGSSLPGHGQHTAGQGVAAPGPREVTCSPTWAQPSADGSKVYVACNKASEILEIDVAEWAITRRMPAAEGVYNLAVTHDGKYLIATNKRGASVSVFDLASGTERARIPTKRKVVHGAVVSPDDRYAFISVEGIGSEPGTVEVIDLRTLESVAAVDVGQQAGGIDFWKTEPAR